METSETLGVSKNTEATDLQDIEKDQPRTEPLSAKGKVPDSISLIPSTQTVYRMDCLRRNHKRYYSYSFSAVMHHAMTQVSLKRGLNKFKEKGEKAISKDLIQLHMNSTFQPLTTGDLSNK